MFSVREKLTEDKKSFMIDYALVILKIARDYIKNTKIVDQ